jgi:hypothetical protein
MYPNGLSLELDGWVLWRVVNKIVQAISALCEAFPLLGKALCTLTGCLWNWTDFEVCAPSFI